MPNPVSRSASPQEPNRPERAKPVDLSHVLFRERIYAGSQRPVPSLVGHAHLVPEGKKGALINTIRKVATVVEIDYGNIETRVTTPEKLQISDRKVWVTQFLANRDLAEAAEVVLNELFPLYHDPSATDAENDEHEQILQDRKLLFRDGLYQELGLLSREDISKGLIELEKKGYFAEPYEDGAVLEALHLQKAEPELPLEFLQECAKNYSSNRETPPLLKAYENDWKKGAEVLFKRANFNTKWELCKSALRVSDFAFFKSLPLESHAYIADSMAFVQVVSRFKQNFPIAREEAIDFLKFLLQKPLVSKLLAEGVKPAALTGDFELFSAILKKAAKHLTPEFLVELLQPEASVDEPYVEEVIVAIASLPPNKEQKSAMNVVMRLTHNEMFPSARGRAFVAAVRQNNLPLVEQLVKGHESQIQKEYKAEAFKVAGSEIFPDIKRLLG